MSEPEEIGPLFGVFLAAMDSLGSTPLCFVLPRRGDAARAAAVLYGLHRFATAEPELARTYGEATFKSGDFVRVHPSKHVYRYLGFDKQFPNLVFLQPPNANGRERRSFDAKAVLRLERTTMKRPVGKMNTPIHDPDPAPLDVLLGTSSFGNQGLFRNEVVLLDSSSGFARFVESTSFQPVNGSNSFPYLKNLIPLGQLSIPATSQQCWFEKWDERHPTGEPLIAVTSSAERLASFCMDAPARTKLVIVNGIMRMKDLQSFDDIQQTQRLILFADADASDLVQALADRGCRLWELTGAEVNAGCSAPLNFDGVMGKLRVWARNKDELTLDAECCESPTLDGVCIRLEALRRFVNSDEQGPVTKLISRMWRMLNESAAIIRPMGDVDRQRASAGLREFRLELQANRAWLTPEAEEALAAAASELEALFASGSDPGASKRHALERVVAECLSAGANSVVLVRSENQALEVDQQFSPHIKSGQVRVCTPRSLKADCAFDRIVCVSWPSSETMQELAAGLASPRITLLGYAFERRWHQQFVRRFRAQRRLDQITDIEKLAIIEGATLENLPAPVDWPQDHAKPTGAPPVHDDVWAFEQRLRAARKGTAAAPSEASETLTSRYVSFVGSTYAFLSETHRVVVVTDLVSAQQGHTRQRLPEKTVDRLRAGDFIVFPESGDRELIQEKADQLLGGTAAQLRRTARLWKEALQRSGLTPMQFLKHARDFGRPRHIMTIRNWFAETSQIGPGTGNEDLSEDLELISLVTDYEALKTRLQDVMDAVKTLRSAHLSAGMRLRDLLIERLPEVLGRVEEEGSVIDLGELGSAWIVQIESIAPLSEPRGRSEVNRLMREAPPSPQVELPF